jgi:branched-chain amino acid transport system ATP-binding protein
MNALEVRNLSKDFGGLRVLDNVSFSLRPGERRGIIGPNGAGKTTLFNIISGNLKPSAGDIFLYGARVTRLPSWHRSRLGLARTFQKSNLFSGLSLYDNLYLALLATDSPFNAKDILKEWGMWEKRKICVDRLSHGEQRQVELLLALAQHPRIILLDEPTAGLSPAETEVIVKIIGDLPRDITILIIEHDMEVVFALAEKITVLHFGQIVAEGSKEEIKSDPRVRQIYLGIGGEGLSRAAPKRSPHLLW